MNITVTRRVDIYSAFRDHDDGSVYPIDVEGLCHYITEQYPPFDDQVMVCHLYECNGRVALAFQLYGEQEERQFAFRFEREAQIRSAIPKQAVAWLDNINQAHLRIE